MADDKNELLKEIQAGKKLDKVSDADKAAREAEKKKKAEDFEKLKAKLKAEGKWQEE